MKYLRNLHLISHLLRSLLIDHTTANSTDKGKTLPTLKLANFLGAHFSKPLFCTHGQIGDTIIFTGSRNDMAWWNILVAQGDEIVEGGRGIVRVVDLG